MNEIKILEEYLLGHPAFAACQSDFYTIHIQHDLQKLFMDNFSISWTFTRDKILYKDFTFKKSNIIEGLEPEDELWFVTIFFNYSTIYSVTQSSYRYGDFIFVKNKNKIYENPLQ